MNKLSLVEGAIPPVRAHKGDAGMDLFIQEDITIPANSSAYCRAGVKLDLSPGYAGLVVSRSSAPKNGANVPVTIVDHGYKDEISSIFFNHTDEPLTLNKGDRVAQLILVPVLEFENEGDVLQASKGDRDPSAKFGSSGKNKLT